MRRNKVKNRANYLLTARRSRVRISGMSFVELAGLWIALVLGASGLIFSAVTLVNQWRSGDLPSLNRRVSELNLELTDLADRTNQFIRRQAVRNTREKGQQEPEAAPLTQLDRKRMIRNRYQQSQGNN